MTTIAAINVCEVIDRSRISRWQYAVFTLCLSCLMVDGFDVQAIGYVAPAIVKDWGIAPSELGSVFGAGLFGLLVGTLVFSICADRFGRRPLLIITTIFFGVCMLATSLVENVQQLMWLRFVTGLGLGGIMPNAVALCGEYCPSKYRARTVMIMSCGFTVGALLGGVGASFIIPWLGWKAVFIIGGVLPIVIGAVMFVALPESLQWQVLNGGCQLKIETWLGRIDSSIRRGSRATYTVTELLGSDKARLKQLLTGEWGGATVLLWITSFMNLLTLYSLASWVPTVAASAGISHSNAVLVGTMLQFGGVVGTISLAFLIGRYGFLRILLPLYVVAAVSIAMVGHSISNLALLFAFVFAAGFCVVGGQPALNAIAVRVYPTTLRATGVGWTVGVGRVGSVIGPVIGGELIRLNFGADFLFMVVSVPSAICVLSIWILCRKSILRETVNSNGGRP